MATTTLNLTVDKGPRAGETLECRPGTQIRIGRVVRGNTFAIRDRAISQKHLLLQFDTAASRWTVSDLNTSNGTLLNGTPVSPSFPAALSHGDNIKIGESTSISVQILNPVEKVEILAPNQGRRGRGRRARGGDVAAGDGKIGTLELKQADVVEKDEIVEPKLVRRARGRRARAEEVVDDGKNDILEPKEAEIGEKNEILKPKQVRKGRGRRARDDKVADDMKNEALEPMQVEIAQERRAGASHEQEGNVNGGEEEEAVEDDMEKMTLREWFDRMEKYLPLVISETAEEIVDGLREKGQMFDKYIATANGSNAG